MSRREVPAWILQAAEEHGVPLPFSVWNESGNGNEMPRTIEELDAYLCEEVHPALRDAGREALDVARVLLVRIQPALAIWHICEEAVAGKEGE